VTGRSLRLDSGSALGEVEFRRAGADDLAAIAALQSANYIGNLAPEERRQGFLSAEFTAAQIAAIASDLGIIVAVASRDVLGYLCAFRRQFDHRSPVLAAMLETFPVVRFEGRPLSAYESFIYGPVCIDRRYRGRGLLRGLYEALLEEMAGRFEVGVAFVARGNPHSLRAHVRGLGMVEVGEFEVGGNAYVTLAFRVPSR
jgi:predicted GNAT superfamily acetyltransferase